MLLNAVICLRVGYTSESLAVMGLSCALLVAAGLTLGVGHHRGRALVGLAPDKVVDIGAIRLVTAATLMAALTGLWVVAL